MILHARFSIKYYVINYIHIGILVEDDIQILLSNTAMRYSKIHPFKIFGSSYKVKQMNPIKLLLQVNEIATEATQSLSTNIQKLESTDLGQKYCQKPS